MGWVQNASPEIDAESKYPTIISVCISMTIFMAAVVTLRVYVRSVMLNIMGIDDWTIIFSAICSIIYNGLCLGQSKWGLGLPIASRPAENLNQYSVINFAGRPFYMAGVLGFKIALCLAYLRILSHGQRTYRYIVWSVLVACALGHIGGTLVLIFQCQPIRKSWLPLTPGICLSNVPTFEALAIVTIFFDFVIFLLPIPVLWALQMNHRRKIALSGVFLLGLFTTMCSILRMIQIPSLAVDGNSTFLVLWGTIEMNVGISLTCVPMLAPLFTFFREKKFPDSSSPRRDLFDSSEMQSIDGIAGVPLNPQRTDPFGSATKPDKNLNLYHETIVPSSDRIETYFNSGPDKETREMDPQEMIGFSRRTSKNAVSSTEDYIRAI